MLKVSLCKHMSENIFLGFKTVFLGQRESVVYILYSLKSEIIFAWSIACWFSSVTSSILSTPIKCAVPLCHFSWAPNLPQVPCIQSWHQGQFLFGKRLKGNPGGSGDWGEPRSEGSISTISFQRVGQRRRSFEPSLRTKPLRFLPASSWPVLVSDCFELESLDIFRDKLHGTV